MRSSERIRLRATALRRTLPGVLAVFVVLFGLAGDARAQAVWSPSGNNMFCITCNVVIGAPTWVGYKVEVSNANDGSSIPKLAFIDSRGGGKTYSFNNGGPGIGGPGFFSLDNNTDSKNVLVVDPTGNIGLGTAAPSQRLTLSAGNIFVPAANGRIDGNVFFGGNTAVGQVGMRLFGGLVNGNTPAGFIDVMTTDPADGIRLRTDNTAGGTERMRITSSGNVGIGTSAPVSPLEVANNVAGLSSQLWISDQNSAANAGGGIVFRADATAYKLIGQMYVVRTNAATSAADLVLRVNDGSDPGVNGLKERMRIASNGDATFTGTVSGTNIKAQYQDLAEWVPASRSLAAGTVVVIDPASSNRVRPSGRAYDTTVAGVVSSQPGLLLGQAGDGKAAVATTGRVKVRVDASQRAIHVGDLLVTSDREGYAMKSQPIEVAGVSIHRPGTLIGKALEPLEQGEGEILVLLSLQ